MASRGLVWDGLRVDKAHKGRGRGEGSFDHRNQ